MKLLTAIRRGIGHVEFPEAAIKEIKVSKVGITSIDNLFENLPYKTVGKEIHIGELPLHQVEGFVRRGELRELVKKLNIPTAITAAEEAGFKDLLVNIPDKDISDFNSMLSKKKVSNADLDIIANNGKELEGKLTKSAKEKLLNAYNKIKSVAGTTVTVGLFVGGVILGADVYQTLVNATNKRNGCFLIRKVNGKVSSCKIKSHSYDKDGNICSDSHRHNIYLLVKRYSEIYSDADNNITYNTLKTIFDNAPANKWLTMLENKREALEAFYYGTTYKGELPLNVDKYFENNKQCVACDPSAGATTIDYINIKDLPENMTVQCVTNSTILDTLVDIAKGTGVSILDGIGSIGNKLLKPIAIFGAIFLILIVIYQVFTSFFRKHD